MLYVGFGDVCIVVVYCGICGSDLYEYVDGLYVILVDVLYLLLCCIVLLMFGYEFCGIVVEVGVGVMMLCVGDCVVVEFEYCCS